MEADRSRTVDLSVIIPVIGRFDDLSLLLPAYREAVLQCVGSFEIILVVDGQNQVLLDNLETVPAEARPDIVVSLARSFGEAACLMQGARQASGRSILILPAYFQIEPQSVPRLFEHLGAADVVTAARNRRGDTPMNRARGWLFDRFAVIAGSRYRDPGCAVRLLRTNILDELNLQDEQHRFLPLLAERAGYSVKLIELPQARMDQRFRHHRPTHYFGTLLDLASLGFLMRFTQKPFRFFGTIGVLFMLAGLILGLEAVYERTVYDVGLEDRPLLLLVVVLIVLGLQIGVVGLIAEIVIFTRLRSYSTYKIERLIERGEDIAPDVATDEPPSGTPLARVDKLEVH